MDKTIHWVLELHLIAIGPFTLNKWKIIYSKDTPIHVIMALQTIVQKKMENVENEP